MTTEGGSLTDKGSCWPQVFEAQRRGSPPREAHSARPVKRNSSFERCVASLRRPCGRCMCRPGHAPCQCASCKAAFVQNLTSGGADERAWLTIQSSRLCSPGTLLASSYAE